MWRMFSGWLCAATLALAQPAPAAPADELAEALALPVSSGLVGARDAARFAWVESVAGVDNIWVATPGRAPRRVTAYEADDGEPLHGLTLSGDGERLAFVRGGDEDFPDGDLPNAGWEASSPRQQLFVAAEGDLLLAVGEGHSPAFAPDGRRLAYTRNGEIWLWDGSPEPRRLATVPGEVRRLSWSPDGKRLLFVDHRGDRSFVALLEIGVARLRYLGPGLGFSVDPVFSPDGGRVAFIRYVEPPPGVGVGKGPETRSYWSIHVADVASGAARELWAAPAGPGGRYQPTRSRNLFWSADGKLVFPWEGSGWLHPHALDARRGGEARELTPGAFEVESFLLGPDGRSVVYAANAGDLDRRHVWRRPLDGGAPVQLTRGGGIESAPTVAGPAVAVIATGVASPAHPAVLEGGGLRPLGRVANARGFAAPEAVVFRAADGLEVRGQLFRARSPGRRPALVFLHGGPRRQMLLGFHPAGYYSRAYAMNQHLAARGYHVLTVNYRGGTGYGLAFRDAPGTGREGASEYRDVLAAGRWLAERKDVDPTRIGLWGGSWGGYLTALGLARDSDLFAAGVDLHGVHSLLRPVPNSLSPDAQAAARELQWQASPLAAIDRWRSPVLLIHGDDDRNVDFSQSLLLARELAARGIPYRELAFPNERHSFLRHANWVTALRATEAFFDSTLGKERAR